MIYGQNAGPKLSTKRLKIGPNKKERRLGVEKHGTYKTSTLCKAESIQVIYDFVLKSRF